MIEKDRSILEENNQFINTIFYYAIKKNNLEEAARLLINYGVVVNSRDISVLTLLHIAVRKSSIDIVRLLLDNEIDSNSRDSYEKTSLHYAARSGSVDIAKLLILNNADPYLKDDEGKSAIDYIEDSRTRNELLFLYKNREKILEEIDRQKDRGVEYDQF